MKIPELFGKRFESVTRDGEDIVFTDKTGKGFRLGHIQDCCESVKIEDIDGDLNDLCGSKITQAEENSSKENPPDYKPSEYGQDSFTWTFYRFATQKGRVVIRFYGESNGYYSESVSLTPFP